MPCLFALVRLVSNFAESTKYEVRSTGHGVLRTERQIESVSLLRPERPCT